MAPRDRNGISIRLGQPDDFDEIFDLILELRARLREKGKPDKKALDQIFRRFLGSNDKCVYVAEADASLVGLMSIAVGESLYDHKPWLEIHELIIKDDYRSRGIGRLLLDEATGRARERGCACISLTADVDNPRAIKFYREYGFDSSEIVLEKELENEATDGGLE